MKKAVIILLLLGAAVASWFAIKAFAFNQWEATLVGPFYGSNYVGQLEGLPVSLLNLQNGIILQIYRVPNCNDPILNLRSALGSNIWSRLLIPEDVASDYSKRHGQIMDIKLIRIYQHKAGYKVYMTCNWNWGGKEAGLIYLDHNFSFQSFSLGW